MDINKKLLGLPEDSKVLITWDFENGRGLVYEVAHIREKTSSTVDLVDEDGVGFKFPITNPELKKIELLTPELEAAIRMEIIETEVT